MKSGSSRIFGAPLAMSAGAVAVLIAVTLVAYAETPVQAAYAQVVEDRIASVPVAALTTAPEGESAVADIRTPSGIAAADAQATGTRTATVVKKATSARAASSATGTAGKSSASSTAASTSGWKSATASWYGPGFYGNTMASGEILTTSSMVVAHRTLPFGTRIEFSYKGRTCVATVMDRGPFSAGRTFDLGPGTAKALGFSGVATVQYRIL